MEPGPEPALASRAKEPARADRGPGFALQVGGGIMNFSSAQMQQLTNTGGYWDVRLVMGLRRVFGAELAYLGTVNPVTAPGVQSGSALLGNGAEGDLRLAVPLINAEGAYIIPYGLAGLGWEHYRIASGDTDGAVLAKTDDVVTVPVGGGMTIGHRHLFLDTRFVYRFTQNEDLIAANGHANGHLRQWTFGGNFGYVF